MPHDPPCNNPLAPEVDLDLAPIEELPAAPPGDIEAPCGKRPEAPLESRHQVEEERLAVDRPARCNLEACCRGGKVRVEARDITAHIDAEPHDERRVGRAEVRRLALHAADLAEAARGAALDVAQDKIVRPLQGDGAKLQPRRIFDRVGGGECELGGNAPRARRIAAQ